MTRFYSGVGSREAPPEVCAVLTEIARSLSAQGWWLRSGHARGSDQAFEAGANGQAVIYRPWSSFEHKVPVFGVGVIFPSPENPGVAASAAKIAARFHPRWGTLVPSHRSLHTRNVPQVLGSSLTDPSQFLVCWTPRGRGEGGTATALAIARAYGVPTFDLGYAGNLPLLRAHLISLGGGLPTYIVMPQPTLF